MAYSIRRMIPGDLDQIQDIDKEAFPTQWPAPNYRLELNNRLAYYIVLCDDERKMEVAEPLPEGKPAPRSFWRRLWPWRAQRYGHTNATAPTDEYLAGFSGIWLLVDEAHITNIALRTEYQGRGLGEKLLIATFDLAMQLHASVLTLEVRTSNTIAQNLYKKYGFEEKGVRKGYYLDNREDALIMTTDTITSDASMARLKELRQALEDRLP